MSSVRQHAEWLSLIEVSGPFLTMPVLLDIFPQGLEKEDDEPELRRTLRMAYDEWADNQASVRPDTAIHRAWLHFVLANVLEMPREVLLEGQALPPALRTPVAEHGEILQPDMALLSPDERKPRLLIALYPVGQDLEKAIAGRRWSASPATRMMELLRRSGVRLGLVTNGERWMLVDAPPNETTGFATWEAALWLEEALTLRAFRSLLGVHRFFGVPDNETLEAMLGESAKNQQEVTDRLGYQVREAVEMLVRSLDAIDKDRQRTLLVNVSEAELYESALTVMMRLVFLLSAEERKLLRLGELLYDRSYAVSTLQATLREQADQFGEEVLERRRDAWVRLLAIFRVVYGGVEHQDLRQPAYGGRLFDPDRFPFLEGRAAGTSWRDTQAQPIAINNRTVLHLLEALQFLQVRVPGGGPAERRRLSFRALDVEQIGHVYEGLLDHTVRRATSPVLGVSGAKGSETEIALEQLETLAAKDEQALLTFLREQTGRDGDALKKVLASSPIPKRFSRSDLRAACDGDADLFERVLPFAGLLRTDTFEKPVVITAGSVYVTQGSDRRSTGTHYTPRSLTEPIVQHTLDPLVYLGPAEGKPQEEWQLRSATDILNLKVCDMAMGSGAFLVQTCRYLAEKLVEAWDIAREQQPEPPHTTPAGLPSTGDVREEQLPGDINERLAIAMRLVSERCLYGVDKNPLAVEMAKLSLWLITLSKDKPFTFLDHALRCGDSLLGVNERQLLNLSMEARAGDVTQMVWMRGAMYRALEDALHVRQQIRARSDLNVRDIADKERLLKRAEDATALARLGADMLIGMALSDARRRSLLQDTLGMEYAVLLKGYEEAHNQPSTEAGWHANRAKFTAMRASIDELLRGRQPFHWFLEFPEVFSNVTGESGFSAIVSNPPFLGDKMIPSTLGTDYREYLVNYLAFGKRGRSDLCAYFFLRSSQVVREHGQCGLLATNSISQADTREVGLDQITKKGWIIYRAISSLKWPGTASLEVAQVWLRNGEWHGMHLLESKQVEGISSFLKPSSITRSKPYVLFDNVDKSFKGVYVAGMGFVLEPQDAEKLIEKNPHNRDVLFPFLNGEDLNSCPDQSPSRWIINFHNWSLEQAESYPDCFEIVYKNVKPERQRLNEQGEYVLRKPLPQKWWIYGDKRPILYATIAKMKRVLTIASTSRTCAFTFVPNNMVFSQAIIVLAFEEAAYFSILQSLIHLEWVFTYGSSMKGDQRYTPTDCFENFPFPRNLQNLNDIGERYYQHRQSIMLSRQEGLTKTYNRFHDSQETAVDIVQLRALHKEMDEAVARAYGWDDLALGHGFHETKQGLRYTISEEARREVLGRLLQLNHERYAEEVALGRHDKGAKKGKGGKKANKTGIIENQNALHASLFDEVR